MLFVIHNSFHNRIKNGFRSFPIIIIKGMCVILFIIFTKLFFSLQVQLGVTPIPKSVTKSRIVSNIQVFDFELSDEDVEKMDSLNKNERYITFESAKGHKEYPFNIDF